jgi:hypothetical protein
MKQGIPLRFRPHKAEFICVSVICVFLLLLSLWLAFLVGPVIYIAFLPLLIIMAFLEHYEFLHFALQITINEKTITLENTLTKENLPAKWTDFQNAYLLQDVKANRFMLLTPNTLSYEEQKRLRRKFYRFDKPHLSIDKSICIYFPNHIANYGKIQNIIQNQIPYHPQPNEPRIWW